MTQELIAVGRIARSVGVRGEMKLEVLTERRDVFRALAEVWIGKSGAEARPTVVERVRFVRDEPMVKLREVDSRTAADALRRQFLFVEAASVPPLNEGTYYVHDIVGMNVVTDEGVTVGVINDVRRLPSGDVWCVEVKGREVMIPAVRPFIRRVDLTARVVTINVIEGLID